MICRATNHGNNPKRGSSIKVSPIRELAAIKLIKKSLSNDPRNLCLFTLGINTAYRACELLSCNIGQVRDLKPGDFLDLKQSKNKKYRMVTVNNTVVEMINQWLLLHPLKDFDEAPLFLSKQGSALNVSSLNRMVKKWCAEAILTGNYGSHSLRKTWGYHQRIQNNAPLPLLTEAYGHSSQKQTLDYLGIQGDEIQQLYMALEL
jgi:integrase